MKIYVLLLLVLGCTHIHGAPLGQDAMTPGSCDDPHAVKATHLALTKINQDRQEGYIFTLNRLSNVHLNKHVSQANNDAVLLPWEVGLGLLEWKPIFHSSGLQSTPPIILLIKQNKNE